MRKEVPRESHAEVRLSATRDPVGLLLTQAEGRVPELVPIRHGRMLEGILPARRRITDGARPRRPQLPNELQ